MNKLQLQLRYGDTDQMGVVYHPNYFTFYELGRGSLLEEIGHDYLQLEKEGIIYPVRDVSSTYIRSIRLEETCYVYTKLIGVTRVKLSFSHEIRNEEGELKSTGHTSIVSVNAKTFLPYRMPEIITEKLKKLMDVE